jgi:hypothetical protein
MRAMAVCLVIACRAPAPRAPSSDESALRAAHEAILAHHRARDWKAMEGSGVVLDVGNGGIHRITPESRRAHFQRYFERAEFTRYEDLVPPIVHVSPDDTTGWVIAQVRVEGTYREDTGVRSPLDTTWSWVELYERAGGEWRMTGIASTHDRDAEPAGLAGLWHGVDTGAATVLAAAEVALGGRAALAAVETLRTEAVVTMPSGRATTRIAAASDGRVRFDQTTSSGEHVVIIARAATPAERTIAIGHALHVLLASPTRWLAGGSGAGEGEFAGRKARAVAFRDAAGNPVRVFYALDTKLPLGAELVEASSQPPELIRVTVDDWRWLGPVRAFHRAVYEHRGKRYEYEYTQIRFNDVAAGELAQ